MLGKENAEKQKIDSCCDTTVSEEKAESVITKEFTKMSICVIV